MNCLPSICLLLKTPKAETTIAMVEGMRTLLISSVASSNLYLSLEIKQVTNRSRNPTALGNQNGDINYEAIFFCQFGATTQ